MDPQIRYPNFRKLPCVFGISWDPPVCGSCSAILVEAIQPPKMSLGGAHNACRSLAAGVFES